MLTETKHYHYLITNPNFKLEKLAEIDIGATGLYTEKDNCLYFSIDNKMLELNLSTYLSKILYIAETEQEYVSFLPSGNLFSASYIRENGLDLYTNEYLEKTPNGYITKWQFKGDICIWFEYGKDLIFINGTDTSIALVSGDNGQVIWSRELGAKLSGNTFTTYKDIIILPLSGEKLVAINAVNGEFLWIIEDSISYYQLDEASGLLYGLGGEIFEVIDIASGKKIVQKSLAAEVNKHKLFVSSHLCNLYNNELYFSSSWSEKKFGRFNLKTYEIDFVQKLDLKNDARGIGAPVCIDGRLFILDDSQSLHILDPE